MVTSGVAAFVIGRAIVSLIICFLKAGDSISEDGDVGRLDMVDENIARVFCETAADLGAGIARG